MAVIRDALLFALIGMSFAKPEITAPYNTILLKTDSYILPIPRHNFNAYEPYITEQTMTVHTLGHHDGYKTKTNNALADWRKQEPENEFAKESILHILTNIEKVPDQWRTTIKNHGGGFVNHCFYFGTLSPNEGESPREPTGELLADITEAFGGLKELKEEFFEGLKNHFGAGYVWLVRTPGAPKPNLKVITTKDQDSPVSLGLRPILTLDLWEHAYYLKHNYKRWDHLADFWMVVDWEYVALLDAWWDNLGEEQRKANERVDKARAAIKERKEKAEKEKTAQEEKEKKAQAEKEKKAQAEKEKKEKTEL